MITIPREYALLPDTDVLPPIGGATMIKGYDRRIPGATKAPELGMMCEDWDRPTGLLLSFAQIKVDGWRAIYLGGPNPRIVTREGEPLLAADRMIPTCQAIEAAYGEPMMFDAEFWVPGGIEATNAAGRSGLHIAHSVLWLFDAIPLSAWLAGRTVRQPALGRAKMLLAVAERVKRYQVGVLRPRLMLDDAAVQGFAERIWNMDGEGAVVKRNDSDYVRQRSGDWRKVKQVDTITVRVVEVSARGTLVCETTGGVRFTVGSGYDAEAKRLITSYPSAIAGRDAVIECSGYTKTHTPRHARFIRMEGK